jgi:poly(A) polymerase
MRLRADIGEVDVVLADWWQEFSQASDAVREDLVAQLREEQHKGQRRVRPARPPGAPAQGDRHPEDNAPRTAEGSAPREDDGAPSDAPKKRRRRRRKPSGEGGGQPSSQSAGPQE